MSYVTEEEVGKAIGAVNQIVRPLNNGIKSIIRDINKFGFDTEGKSLDVIVPPLSDLVSMLGGDGNLLKPSFEALNNHLINKGFTHAVFKEKMNDSFKKNGMIFIMPFLHKLLLCDSRINITTENAIDAFAVGIALNTCLYHIKTIKKPNNQNLFDDLFKGINKNIAKIIEYYDKFKTLPYLSEEMVDKTIFFVKMLRMLNEIKASQNFSEDALFILSALSISYYLDFVEQEDETRIDRAASHNNEKHKDVGATADTVIAILRKPIGCFQTLYPHNVIPGIYSAKDLLDVKELQGKRLLIVENQALFSSSIPQLFDKYLLEQNLNYDIILFRGGGMIKNNVFAELCKELRDYINAGGTINQKIDITFYYDFDYAGLDLSASHIVASKKDKNSLFFINDDFGFKKNEEIANNVSISFLLPVLNGIKKYDNNSNEAIEHKQENQRKALEKKLNKYSALNVLKPYYSAMRENKLFLMQEKLLKVSPQMQEVKVIV